jgi:hypothetical protein
VPPVGNFVAFAAVAAVIIAIPGPSVLFTISRALTMGRRVALLNVVGNAAGCYLQVIAVAVGVGVLLERSLLAFMVVKFAGAPTSSISASRRSGTAARSSTRSTRTRRWCRHAERCATV